MAATKFGPGTVTFTVDVGTPEAFEQEIKSGGITHEYETVGDDVTYLDGNLVPAEETRADKLTLECDFDLGSAGFYNFLFTNDLTEATAEYTPNTANTAKWAGTVRLKLPNEAKGEEFGAKLAGTVELAFVGPVVFTSGT
jgi:hypothetical protein